MTVYSERDILIRAFTTLVYVDLYVDLDAARNVALRVGNKQKRHVYRGLAAGLHAQSTGVSAN